MTRTKHKQDIHVLKERYTNMINAHLILKIGSV